MNDDGLSFDQGVTLVGGGALSRDQLDAARRFAPILAAADGGADALLELGEAPRAILGDLDSLSSEARWRARGATVLRIDEQDSTDFEKCLYSVTAPFFIGVGFLGRRFDHTLAALHGLLTAPARKAVLLGEADAVFLTPPRWRIRLEVGARVSFFPLTGLRGIASQGLAWPIDGLDFAPGRRIGVSNRAVANEVAAEFDGPGMLAMVSHRRLGAVLDSLGALPSRDC